MENIRFAVYKKNVVTNDGILVDKYLITLNKGKDIIKWTNYHKYLTKTKENTVFIGSSNRNRAYDVCRFLNFVFFEKYHINTIEDITVEMAQDFLYSYGMKTLAGDSEFRNRNKKTVQSCIYYIYDFLYELLKKNKNMKYKKSDLYEEVQYFNHKTRANDTKLKPIIEVFYKDNDIEIFRDMPSRAFNVIMTNIRNKHKNILMLSSSEAYAGLRAGESCNLRRTDSILGPGIIFTLVDGEIYNIDLDITEELCLRSDCVNTGKIKKHRRQSIYPKFIEAFYKDYEIYMDYIKNKKYEINFGPLTTNSKGMAITYSSYLREFKKAVKECIPIMLQSEDPELVFYGQKLLNGAKISPHILRHWFTVQLVLDGCDVAEIAKWRGDKSLESALTYLKNKGDLQKKYEKVSDGLFDIMYNLAKEKHDNEN